MKRIYLLYISCIAALFVSCEKDALVPALRFAPENESLGIKYSTADLLVDIPFNEENNKYQLLYSLSEDFANEVTAPLSRNAEGRFECHLSGLTQGTTYFYRYKVVGDFNYALAPTTSSFSTWPYVVASVSTDGVSGISYIKASVAVSMSNWGCETYPEWGLCYSTKPGASVDDKCLISPRDTNYLFALSGLSDSTTYYVRAYAKNVVGVSYGEELSFMTVAYKTPSVETLAPSSVTAHAAICRGDVSFDGGLSVTEKGFCYSTHDNPTVTGEKMVSPIAGEGSFSCALTDLQATTTYYIRAYAINSKGIAYGKRVTITTKKD